MGPISPPRVVTKSHVSRMESIGWLNALSRHLFEKIIKLLTDM